MGSLRNPAGWHGLYSHRPTAGWLATDMDTRYCPPPVPHYNARTVPIGTGRPGAHARNHGR
jgi:Asp-tRNA(Asn)/Glu-tRNA(Gln) amidotransferase A subunit family amidase